MTVRVKPTAELDAWKAVHRRTCEIRSQFDDPWGFDWNEYNRAKSNDAELSRLMQAWAATKEET